MCMKLQATAPGLSCSRQIRIHSSTRISYEAKSNSASCSTSATYAQMFFLICQHFEWQWVPNTFPKFSLCSLQVFNMFTNSQWVFNIFLKFPMCSPTYSQQSLTFIPYALANVVHLSPIGESKGKNPILQNKTSYFGEPPQFF